MFKWNLFNFLQWTFGIGYGYQIVRVELQKRALIHLSFICIKMNAWISFDCYTFFWKFKIFILHLIFFSSFSFEACFQFNSSVLSHGTFIKIRYRIEAETFTGKKYYRTKFKASLDSETPNIVEKELQIRGVSLYEPHCSRQLVYLKVT